MSDSDFALSLEERKRLVEANSEAAWFYRQELLRATSSWSVEYLKSWGAEDVLSTESTWTIGYAPDASKVLVNHLRANGFGFGTLVRAGLVTWTEDGEGVAQHRNQLMLLARDMRLAPAGFVGIGPDGQARSASPVTMIHRPSNVLVGVHEQRDLLSQGAIPVIVDDPVDAFAVSKVSRQSDGRWVGIPVCGAGLSTAQARMLRRFSATDNVIVALSGDDTQRNQSAGYLLDLAFFFDRVRAVGMPGEHSPATLALCESGPDRLHEALSNPLPLMLYRASGRAVASAPLVEPEPPDGGPGL